MKAVTGRENYLSLAMGAISLLLAGVLLWEWEQGNRLGRELANMRKMPLAAVPAPKILPEFNLPNAETGFPELLARPIFSVSRRASATASQGVAGAMQRGQFVLVGVLITPNQRSALLRSVESNKTETVAMGAQIGGLTLGEVAPDKVVLRLGAESEELTLKVQVGAPPAPTPGGQGQGQGGQAPAAPASAPVPASPPAATPPAVVRPAVVRPTTPLPPPKPTPSVPRELSAEERAVAEKQYKAMIEDRVKKGLPLPTTPPPWANGK